MKGDARMRKRVIFILSIVSPLLVHQASASVLSDTVQVLKPCGSYYSKVYKNLFAELLGQNESKIHMRIDSAFDQLFYGNDSTQRIYYPVDPESAYIEDIIHNDVRTEGMSYGMMIAVQLNRKNEFDRLWKWAKRYMQHATGQYKDLFAWHCKPNGSIIDSNSASDGEEWFVMTLFFASARWGDGKGMYNYKAEAQSILDAMLNKEISSNKADVVTNMFNRKEKQVVFVPMGNADDFTDPSYHTPHYYELGARWADKENQFWCDVAFASREFLKKAAHPSTGLFPDYAQFNGSSVNPWGAGKSDFRYDAWRVSMNIAIDNSWFAKDGWAITQSNRVLDFFHSEGIGKYGNQYTLHG